VCVLYCIVSFITCLQVRAWAKDGLVGLSLIDSLNNDEVV